MSADPLPPEKAPVNVKSTSKPVTVTRKRANAPTPEKPKVEAVSDAALLLEAKAKAEALALSPPILAAPVTVLAVEAPSAPADAPAAAPVRVRRRVGPRKVVGTRPVVALAPEVAVPSVPARHRARNGDATRNQISKVWLSPQEIDRIDRVRKETSRGEWIRSTLLRVAGEGNLPAVDMVLQDDIFQPRLVVVNFRLTLDELKSVDSARGRQARCTWMREAVLRIAYPESEKHAAK